jgi:hypothetical protein
MIPNTEATSREISADEAVYQSDWRCPRIGWVARFFELHDWVLSPGMESRVLHR